MPLSVVSDEVDFSELDWPTLFLDLGVGTLAATAPDNTEGL